MVKIMEFIGNMIDRFKGREPSPEELKIYSLLTSEEGKMLMDWLRARTIERQIGHGVQDGIQTAILTARELGRNDIYHELSKLLIKVSSYANRE